MSLEGRHSKAKALNQMRLWLSGPRLFNGLVRPGISLGKEDFRPARKARAMVAEATLGLFRRPDGAILMAIAHMNGDADTMPDMTPVAAFAFTSVPASVEVREGALVRLAKHIGPDGLVAGMSVGQRVSADDMDFPPMLESMTTGTEAGNQTKSNSAKTAHCAHIARIAKSYGFTH